MEVDKGTSRFGTTVNAALRAERFVGERHIQRVTIAGDEVEPANSALPVYEPYLNGIRGQVVVTIGSY